MSIPRSPLLRPLVTLLLLTAAGHARQEELAELPAGPRWGRDTLFPEDANEVFATADGCANCHGRERNAEILVGRHGDDATPHGTWLATTMANAARDPYFRAQLAREVERSPGRAVEIERSCLACHAPMAFHTARLANRPATRAHEFDDDPLALDGVSCTVCHQAHAGGLGDPASFNGHLDIRPGRVVFGPYEQPSFGSMLSHTAYTAVHGEHLKESALCGSCHVLESAHGSGARFLEQATYLEWRNSSYSDEGEAGHTESSRSCGDCHMKAVDAVAIRRPATTYPFDVSIRPSVHTHATVGGNAFLLDMLRENRDAFGVVAADADLVRVANATRAQLAHDTARLEIANFRTTESRLRFDVTVENLTGHKFPSGYPSRRAWLDVEVRVGRRSVFRSGAFAPTFGDIEGVDEPFAVPHHDRITKGRQVQVYEMVAAGTDGEPTTILSDMVAVKKDNRLLPKGWTAGGPHAAETAPVGVDGDDDFRAGYDTVTYSVRRPRGRAVVVARLYYQPIPPGWADALYDSETPEAEAFTAAYLRADPAPELVASAVARSP